MEVNEGIISGRLTADPILRETKTLPPKPVVNLSIAQDHPMDWRKPRAERRTCYWKVRAWGRTAENIARDLIKGDRVQIGYLLVQEEGFVKDTKIPRLDAVLEIRWIVYMDVKKYAKDKPSMAADPDVYDDPPM